ncbi:hypothetical protein DPMN_180665 [Dreissena polymorpha]|uniref:protein-tyrosine-phosphatase n=1 Tax=Dreissena polymorpha TaxID=45954 RepID=A0A9D4EGJ8_DREPO|nr:hypothetical protein DPMN_180665 [Dreissena polymorpha]
MLRILLLLLLQLYYCFYLFYYVVYYKYKTKGTYGQDCNQTCGHCLHLVPCDVVSGRCESCLEGYTGDSCDTLVEESNQFPVELVSGVSTGILILLVALIMSVVLLIRKKKGKRTQEHSNVTTVREPISSVNDEPQQMAAEKSDNEQKCLPAQSADSVTTTVIQEPVYSNMKDLPPVESLGTAIALCQLQGYVMSKSADEPFFSLEFKVVPTAATAPVNAEKNRYKDMYAYDHCRVVLDIVDSKQGSDYINACFIEGFFKKRAYIASQGPTKAMMDDFWQMIWQYDVSTVVMVTNLVEMAKVKCLRYWPLEVGSKMDFQALTTTLIYNEEFTDYTVRKLKLSHKPSISRVVTHFHYTAWPNKDVPASTSSLLHFWRRIRAHDPDKKQPWVVHCSAGVGRTGTFIAMDILIDEGQARQTVDIYACVTKLRLQRVNMVQTATEASYHTLELAGANIKGDEGDPYSVATMSENAKKNRFDAILPTPVRHCESRDISLVVTFPDEGNEQCSHHIGLVAAFHDEGDGHVAAHITAVTLPNAGIEREDLTSYFPMM